MAALLPLAHVSHYLWVLYVPPILIVVASIVRVTLVERRKAREEEGELEDLGEPPLERR